MTFLRACATFEAPFSLAFGTDPGRVGLDGLLLDLPRPEDWVLQTDSLRYQRDEGGFETSTLTASVENLAPGQDFTLQSDVELGFLSGGNLNRIGFVVLGREHDPFGAPFEGENDNLYYSLQWLPRTSGDDSTLRIRRGFNGSDLTSPVVWEGLHPDDVDPSAGWGEVFELEADGVYDPETGALTLSLTLTDVNGHAQTVSAEIEDPRSGNVFGIGARMRSDELPEFSFANLAMTVGDAPDPDTPSFSDWREEHFTEAERADPGISGPGASPAGDGIANLLKYAADLPPKTPAVPEDLTRPELADGHLTLTYRELAGAQDIEYVVEVSTDLIEWQSGPDHVEEITRTPGERVDKVTARAVLPDGAPAGFMRLTVILP